MNFATPVFRLFTARPAATLAGVTLLAVGAVHAAPAGGNRRVSLPAGGVLAQAAVPPLVPPGATTPPPLATPNPRSSPAASSSPSPSPAASPAPAAAVTGDGPASPVVSPLPPILPASSFREDTRRGAGRVRRAELRVEQPAPIPVALSSEEGEGTLVSFPLPIRHLDGFGVLHKPPAAGERGDFYVLWPGGSRAAGGDTDDEDDNTRSHFVVTALRKGARKTLSVVLQGQPRPFTLVLVQTDDDVAALSVHFELPAAGAPAAIPSRAAFNVPSAEAAAPGTATGAASLLPAGWDGRRVPLSPARLDGFMTKLQGYPTLHRLKPEMFENIEAVETPSGTTPDEWSGGLRAHLVRVLRDHRLDALGFEVRLENAGSREFVYDPDALAVRVEGRSMTGDGAVASARPVDEIYRARWTSAAGRVAPGGVASAFFVIATTEEGEANDLSPRNHFRLVLEAPVATTVPSRRRPVPAAPRPLDRSKG